MIRLPRYFASVLFSLVVTSLVWAGILPLIAIAAWFGGHLPASCWWMAAPLCVPFALWLPLLAYPNGYLPGWLGWFQTPDAPIWGDSTFAVNQGAGKSWYVRAVMWMYRNPAQGLDKALGAWYPLDGVLVVRGDPKVSDAGGIAGWCWVTLGGYFLYLEITPIRPWLQWIPLFKGKCIHAEFGWRLQQIAQDYKGGMANPMTRQLVFSLRLFRFGS